MAKSTYITSNLTPPQIAFLKMLDDHEVEYFALEDIEERLGLEVGDLNEIVENLADKGLLDRIERGKYTRPNFKDPNVLGTFITPADAAIGYWSALSIHGMTTRFPQTVFIKTTAQKRSKRIFGVFYKFIKVKPGRFIGTTYHGHGNHRYAITDVEMTIVDCFDQPRYGGDFPDLIRAFVETDLDQERMIKYTKAYGNRSLLKRLGYLAELLDKPRSSRFIAFALRNVNERYALLDPYGEETGSFDNRWRLRLNLSPEEIESIVRSEY